MSAGVINGINSGVAWLIVALCITGYVVTVRRTGQRWSLWIPMATGWALLATPYTLLLVNVPIDVAQLSALWLSSYLLVMASLLLLFLKMIHLIRHRTR